MPEEEARLESSGLQPLVVVIDDDVTRLAPFFVPLLEAKGHTVVQFARWGEAATWLDSESARPDKSRVAAVVLDVMFALRPEDQQVFRDVVGHAPGTPDAKIAGTFLIPLIHRHLEGIPILVLSNYMFQDTRGKHVLGEGSQYVAQAFTKPPQEEFFSALSDAVKTWVSVRQTRAKTGGKNAA